MKAAAYTPNYAVGVNQIADPNPVEAGQILHYTINYSNTGDDDVHGVAIKDIYDQNVTYQSSIPLTSPGKGDSWTIGDLKPGESGDIKVEVRVNPSAADGTLLKNTVSMASTEASSEAIAETTVKVIPRNLTKAENKTLPLLGENNTSSMQTGNNSENNTTFDLKKLEIIPLIGANNTSSIQIGNNSLNNTTIKVIKLENHILVGANNTSSSQIASNSENNTTIATTKLNVLPLSQLNNESSTQMGNNSKNNTAIATTKLNVIPLSQLNNESSFPHKWAMILKIIRLLAATKLNVLPLSQLITEIFHTVGRSILEIDTTSTQQNKKIPFTNWSAGVHLQTNRHKF